LSGYSVIPTSVITQIGIDALITLFDEAAFEHAFQGAVKRARPHPYLLIGPLGYFQHDSISMPVLVYEGQENVKDGGCQCRHNFNTSVADILKIPAWIVNALALSYEAMGKVTDAFSRRCLAAQNACSKHATSAVLVGLSATLP
jgi:hypothetical protein